MRNRSGFTLIEVTFFLAFTGLLFLTVTVGVQNSIFRQRYNDSAQSFAEFLRGIYAEVTNVQSANSGNSNQAIFGKLVTFGESKDFTGNVVNTSRENNTVFVYDVVGKADLDMSSDGILDMLKKLGANVLVKDGDMMKPAGIVENYAPKWMAQIQDPDNTDVFKGALLVVRHPRSGVVYTFVKKKQTIEVNSKIGTLGGDTVPDVLGEYLNSSNFSLSQVDFCISPDGNNSKKGRADVRIKADARNSSGIETFFDEDNKCDG